MSLVQTKVVTLWSQILPRSVYIVHELCVNYLLELMVFRYRPAYTKNKRVLFTRGILTVSITGGPPLIL